MKRQNYEAPEMELTTINVENNFLESFNSGSGSASANKMDGETWSSWDAE